VLGGEPPNASLSSTKSSRSSSKSAPIVAKQPHSRGRGRRDLSGCGNSRNPTDTDAATNEVAFIILGSWRSRRSLEINADLRSWKTKESKRTSRSVAPSNRSSSSEISSRLSESEAQECWFWRSSVRQKRSGETNATQEAPVCSPLVPPSAWCQLNEVPPTLP